MEWVKNPGLLSGQQQRCSADQGCQPATWDTVFGKNRILKTESASTFQTCIQLHKTAS